MFINNSVYGLNHSRTIVHQTPRHTHHASLRQRQSYRTYHNARPLRRPAVDLAPTDRMSSTKHFLRRRFNEPHALNRRITDCNHNNVQQLLIQRWKVPLWAVIGEKLGTRLNRHIGASTCTTPLPPRPPCFWMRKYEHMTSRYVIGLDAKAHVGLLDRLHVAHKNNTEIKLI